jgi:hypothetical protein
MPLGEVVTKNEFSKPTHWSHRASYTARGANPPNAWEHNGKVKKEQYGKPWEEVVPGENDLPYVRFRAVEFAGIDPSEEDGAFVVIQGGHRTSVQGVASETTFSEVPLEGRLVFLSVNPYGVFNTHYFDIDGNEDSPHMMQVTQGWLMSWYACKDQHRALANNDFEEFLREVGLFNHPSYARVLEHEVPGFSESSLPTIEANTENFNGTPIPPEFWSTIYALDEGREEEVLAAILK